MACGGGQAGTAVGAGGGRPEPVVTPSCAGSPSRQHPPTMGLTRPLRLTTIAPTLSTALLPSTVRPQEGTPMTPAETALSCIRPARVCLPAGARLLVKSQLLT